MSIVPDPGEVELPAAGSPPGKIGQGMVRDVATEASGAGGMGWEGGPDSPLKPLRASGA